MSYPVQAAPRRPGAVVSAAAVLLLMAVGAVAYAIAGLAVAGGTVTRFRAAADATGARAGDIDAVAAVLRGTTVLAAVVGVLTALVLIGLALGLLSGRRGARTGTWVVAGLGLLCGCCGVAAVVGQRAAPLRVGADGRRSAELFALLGDAYPGWWIPANVALSVAQVLGYLVVAALLVTPAAGAFFGRRPAPSGPAGAPPPAAPPTPLGSMPPIGPSHPAGPPNPAGPYPPVGPHPPAGSTSPPEDRP